MGHEGTELDAGGASSSGPPAAKLPDEGNTLTFALVDCNPNVPDLEYGTGEQKLNRFGKPKMQTVVTVLVISGDGAQIGKKDERTPVEVGSLVSIFISSYAKFDPDQDKLGGTHISWGGAVDKVGQLRVGMVGQWKHLGELPSQGNEPRKNRKFALRAAKPEEAAQVERCEQLHREMHEATELVGAGPGPFDGPSGTDTSDPGF